MAAEERRSYGSDTRVAELQRGRLLDAMSALIHELGYANVANPSNREIARAASVKDEGQISKLLPSRGEELIRASHAAGEGSA
jgi:hypothetical protein